MTKDEALKLALEALDIVKIHFTQNRHVNEAITAIKQALAAPVQEPVAIPEYVRKAAMHLHKNGFQELTFVKAIIGWINSAPLQRTWVGLTEKDICEAAVKSQEGISPRDDTLRFAIAIEAKLKEKNS